MRSPECVSNIERRLLIFAYFLAAFIFPTTVACHAEDLAGLFETSSFDRSVRVQDDLFEHVNGTWLRETEIPSDKSDYGTFGKLADLSQKRTRQLIEQAAAGEFPKGSPQQKVGDFYKSFMDVARVESLGAKPLKRLLDAVEQLATPADIWRHFGVLSSMNVDSPVGLYVAQDAKNSDQYITHVIQSGLTLPDRDYYLNQEESSIDACEAMRQYIIRLFELTDIPGGDQIADQVVALETELAEISWDRVKLRQADLRYNKFLVTEFDAQTPNTSWTEVLAANEIEVPETMIVGTPSFFEALDSLMTSVPIETWRRYVQYKIIDEFAPYLSQPFVDANFEFYEQQLAGVPEQKPRWKRTVNKIAGEGGFGALGDVVGQLYVEKHFQPESKQAMDELVVNLLRAFESSIDDLAWMTDETKTRAAEKLSKIRTKIGYPKKWRDYSALEIDPDDLFGNVLRSHRVEHHRNVDRLGKPVDRDEWGMTPQTVNAYYNPTKNEIVFPAAILQPPFFDVDAPKALNYGGIGAVIGHEISHAFDDQGSKYDGDGNLNNWWTDEDRAAFEKLTNKLVVQFASYEPLPGKRVDGELTLGENIADLSGLAIAYRALKIATANDDPVEVAGWNEDQLFFVGWSRVWQRKYRDTEMIKRLLNDPHSPSRYRANGPVSNIDAFYQAFDLQPGDKLFRPESERIRIW